MKRPLALGCLSFAAGVWCADMLLRDALWLAIPLGALALSAVLVYFLMKKAVLPLLALITTAAMCAGCLWGWCVYKIQIEPSHGYIGQQIQAEMLITDYPKESQYGYLVSVRLFDVSAAFFTTYEPDVRPGDTVSALVNIGEYSRMGYNIKAVQASPIIITKADRVPLTMYPARMRHELINRIELIFPSNADFAAALVVGDQSGFSQEFKTALSVSGLAHVVSVSGLHISFITGVFVWIFGGVRRASPFAIPFVILFVAIVGFPPSAVRSAVMNILMLISVLIKRDYDARVSLSVALAIIVFAQPSAALDVGLQLSFAATFGIISFAGLWSAAVFNRFPILSSKLLSWTVYTFSTTAAALVFTIPLTAYYFGVVSLVAPISNLLTLSIVSVLFLLSLLAIGISYIFLPVAKVVGLCLSYGYELVKWTINTIAKIPLSAIYTFDVLTIALLIFQYAVLAICFISWRRGNFRLLTPLCVSVCSLCMVVLATSLYYDYSNTFRMTAVNVGQGQSLMMSTKARTVVVDCGGVNAGFETMKAALSQGADSIDALVLTHAHADHANGVPMLLERMSVGAVIMFDDDEEISMAAERNGVPVVILSQDTVIKMGESELRLILPRDGLDVNERCLSVVADYNGFTMLVTGDLNSASERNLLRNAEIPELDLHIVGHHGSKYSTCETLLDYTKPKLAVVSVGANNYGHPTPEALGRLEAIGAMVYRTDIHGSITITVGG